MLSFMASVLIGAGHFYYPTITSQQPDSNGYYESFVQRQGLHSFGAALQKADNLARRCNHDHSNACAFHNQDYQQYLLTIIVPH